MEVDNDQSSLSIWSLALGYFVFYTPYSMLTKLLSDGSLYGDREAPIAGLVLLPTILIATVVVVYLCLTLLGWWRYAKFRSLLGLRLPFPGLWTTLSGLGTAVIIATTTLAYTFEGVSILLALLLMRGGVLIMSPIIDFAFRRPVHWRSWMALLLCLTAVTWALADLPSYALTIAAVVNLAWYLTGYVVRLQSMTRVAKRDSQALTRRYFVEEQLVSMPALILVPLAVALLGKGETSGLLWTGFTTFLTSNSALPAFVIGLFYGCLFMFGSLIYLDHRENTSCVAVNRCSSLVAGIVASYALTHLFDQPPVADSQLIGATFMIAALLVLSLPTSRPKDDLATGIPGRTPAERLVLFVCGGNTSRSPMAKAICQHLLAAFNRDATDWAGPRAVQIESAGLSAVAGAPLTAEARVALEQLGIAAPLHAAQPLTRDMVHRADVIFCMSEEQRCSVGSRFPDAEMKTHRLHPDHDILDPSGLGPGSFRQCAERIREALVLRLSQLGPEAA
jgi:protein-tyrosine-phosphatase